MMIKNIKPVEPSCPFEAYAHLVAPLTAEDGGEYMITFPDLPGTVTRRQEFRTALHSSKHCQ